MNTKDGVNQERQQYLNRALVIDFLRQEGVCSRAKLASLSNLKRATITNIINDFMACGLVVETGILNGEKNRRSIGIKINGKTFRVIGVMLTRRHYSIISMGLSGEVYETKRYSMLKGTNADDILTAIKASIQVMIDVAKTFDQEVLAIGIAMPGPYKHERGEVIFVSNLSDWEGVPIYAELQEAFPIPVFIENDANAGAYAQLWNKGRDANFKNLVYIVAGHGIGCGVIVNGNILSGENGLAGEIGHTSIRFDGNQCECGNKGCLETYCSTIVLERTLRECIENGDPSILNKDFVWADVVDAINMGDALTCREYSKACKYLAVGIVNIINQLNPGIVIIGDLLAELQPRLMLQILNKHIRKTIRPLIWEDLKIEINTSVINPTLTGAAVIAAQKILENPFEYIKQPEKIDA